MDYGTPKNFRAPPARESNKSGPIKKKFGLKKFGLVLTHHKVLWRRKALKWTQWYRKEAGRDEAYKHYVNQRSWYDQTKSEFAKVEKIER